MINSIVSAPQFNPADMPDSFVAQYGGSPHGVRVFSAPARINIIGEHIDYNGGTVMPMAINHYLYTAIRPRNDTKITYNDLRFPGTFSFSLAEPFIYKAENSYANYLNGILSQLSEKNKLPDTGFDVLLASNIPAGGSISSSSALECGFAWAVNETFSLGLDRVEIARLGQMSEHRFMNVQCGIMDQFIIATGKKGTAELLDCATLAYEYVPVELEDTVFVVMNTNKSRKLAESKYNERRSQCESALESLKKAALPLSGGKVTNTRELTYLCDLTVDEFRTIETAIPGDTERRRARHCITENDRVTKAAAALRAGDLNTLGTLMKESHKSLRDDYEVTGLELDTITGAAAVQEGCIGTRMTGAGFAGCAIALVKKESCQLFMERVAETYIEKIGYAPSFFTCESGDGVKEYV